MVWKNKQIPHECGTVFLKRRKECVCSFLLAVWRYNKSPTVFSLVSAPWPPRVCSTTTSTCCVLTAEVPWVSLMWYIRWFIRNDTLQGENRHDLCFGAARVQFPNRADILVPSNVSNSPVISELLHSSCEINCCFLFCVVFSPLGLSGRMGQTGKTDNKWEAIGGQVEYTNLKRNKLLMFSCNS